jgi:hypothetical protein
VNHVRLRTEPGQPRGLAHQPVIKIQSGSQCTDDYARAMYASIMDRRGPA